MPPSDLDIDWVSPLPPVRSGIADYSLDLLPHLRSLARLRVVRVPGQPVDETVLEGLTAIGVDQLGRGPAGCSPLPVYQLGNNRYHEPIYRLALKVPGVATLHDVFLHHLLMDRTLGHGDHLEYVAELTAEHGWVGGAVSMPPRWGAWGTAGRFALPVHRRVLERQRGVVVHSEWAADRVREESREAGVAWPELRVVPMAMPLPSDSGEARVAAAELRNRWGIPLSAPVLGSFGFQTPIKRTLSVLRALAREELRNAWLLVAGEVSPELALDETARELGVADRVRVTGFLPEEDFSAAILACDLCVNLRYPTAGETSASLLRILALGRPCLVSDYAQFAELPDPGIVRAPLDDDPEDEATQLAARLRELLADRPRLREMGRAGRARVERDHDPAAVARTYTAALGELADLPIPDPGERARRTTPLSGRASSLIWNRMHGTIELLGERQWEPGERRRIAITLTNRSFARWLPASAGEGGVAVEVALIDDSGSEPLDLRRDRSWIPLRRELAPGRSCRIELDLRRPLGPGRLVVEPHVVGRGSFSSLGGPRLEIAFDGSSAASPAETHHGAPAEAGMGPAGPPARGDSRSLA